MHTEKRKSWVRSKVRSLMGIFRKRKFKEKEKEKDDNVRFYLKPPLSLAYL